MPNFAFMAGLPRSGSTLLSAILSQRPDVHAPGNCNSADVLAFADQGMKQDESYLLGTNWRQRESLIRNALPALYAYVAEDWVVDRSRLWGTPYHVQLLRYALGAEPKILAPVRPLAEIVASFLRLCNANPGNYIDESIRQENLTVRFRKPLDDVRVDYLLQPNSHLGVAMLGLYSAFTQDFAHNFHLIQYGDLATDPAATLQGIERFMGWQPHDYDFDKVAGVVFDDSTLGVSGMHDVRPSVRRHDPDPSTILSDYAMTRCTIEDFWTDR